MMILAPELAPSRLRCLMRYWLGPLSETGHIISFHTCVWIIIICENWAGCWGKQVDAWVTGSDTWWRHIRIANYAWICLTPSLWCQFFTVLLSFGTQLRYHVACILKYLKVSVNSYKTLYKAPFFNNGLGKYECKHHLRSLISLWLHVIQCWVTGCEINC